MLDQTFEHGMTGCIIACFFRFLIFRYIVNVFPLMLIAYQLSLSLQPECVFLKLLLELQSWTGDFARLDHELQPLHLATQESQDQSIIDGVRCPHPTIDGHLTTMTRVIQTEVPLRQLHTTSVQALQYLPPRERTVPQMLQPGGV